MQSDFIRVHWILEHGGVYSDLTFAPQENPIFWNEVDELVCARWQHGRIINGLFYAQAKSKILADLAVQIYQNVKNRTSNNIRNVTGPGAWQAVLSRYDMSEYKVVEREVLFAKYIKHSKYTASTRNTEKHWSKMQQTQSIYRDA